MALCVLSIYKHKLSLKDCISLSIILFILYIILFALHDTSVYFFYLLHNLSSPVLPNHFGKIYPRNPLGYDSSTVTLVPDVLHSLVSFSDFPHFTRFGSLAVHVTRLCSGPENSRYLSFHR